MTSTCAEEVKFFMLVLCPTMVKGTKTSLELGRTFATLLADMSLRHSLMECHNERDFRRHMMAAANNVADPNGNENFYLFIYFNYKQPL